MANKKKRNKKYSALKNTHVVNEAILKHYYVAYMADGKDRDIELLSNKGDKKPVSKTMARAIENFRYKWAVLISVFGYEKNGKQRCEHSLVTVDKPVYQHEIVDTLNDEHKELIAEFKKKNEVIGASWLASPVLDDIDEDEAVEIYKKMGAWS